jgi:WD40 repeat protein
VVFRAVDSALRREVALKLLPSGLLASRDAMRRFFTEAQAAARLGHPNIIPIYEIGDGAEGQPFMAMQLIAGGTLAARLKRGPLPPDTAVTLMEKVAHAIQHAHERGVLHRDIKPGNVLLSDENEPMMTDFGLARLIEADSTLTRPEALLGTLAYLAPELAAGRAHEVTVLADIYALGAVLYECLAGRPPFSAGTTAGLLRKIIEEEPPPLRKSKASTASGATDRDLETICLKCLEKEPAQRYASAAALAEDLARWRRREPIRARPSMLGERMVKWAKRRPLIAALSAGLFAVGVAGLAGVLVELQRARAGEHVALLNQYAADMAVVSQSLLAGDIGRARTLLEQHRPRPGQPDLRGWEWSYFYSEASHSDELATLGRHATRILWTSFSADGQWLATADVAGELRLWEVRTRRLAAQAHQAAWPTTLEFTPDGRFLISAHGGGVSTKTGIHWWSLPSLHEVRPPVEVGNLIQALLSPDGRRLFVLRNVGDGIDRLTAEGKTELRGVPALLAHAPAGVGALSPDGSFLAYEAVDGLVVWDITRNTVQVFSGHQRRTGWPFTISGFAFAPDGSKLVTCGLDGAVRVWPLRSNIPPDSVRELTDIGGVISQVAFIHGGRVLAGASTDQTIHLWDTRTWRLVGRLRGHGSAVTALAASPDGALLASGSMDGEVKLFSTELSTTQPTAVPLPAYVLDEDDLALAPDGSYLLTRNRQTSTFQLWNTATLAMQSNIPAPQPEFRDSAVVAPGGRWLAFMGMQGTQVVSRDGSASPQTLNNSTAKGFSPDGRLILSYEITNVARIWDLSGAILAATNLGPEAGGVRSVAISGGGEYVALGFYAGEVPVWNWRTKQVLQLNAGRANPVSGLAFSPDGRQLATASYSSEARVFDLPSGRERYHITASSFELDSVAWSPNGRRLATGANDGIVRIWDLETTPPREIAVLPGHNNAVETMAFTADGNTLVTVSRDSLRVWRADNR